MEENIEIDVFKLFHKLWGKLPWIVATAVVFALAMFLLTTFFSTPMYRAEAVVYISNKVAYDVNRNTANIVDVDASRQLVPVYSSLIMTNAVLDRVSAASQLPYTANQIAGLIRTEPIEGTAVLKISALAPVAEHCATLANTVATTGITEITKIAPGSSAYIIDAAETPVVPYSPSVPRRVILGFLVGALISAVAVVVHDLLDTKINTEEDFARLISAPVLGVVGKQKVSD